MTIATNFFTFIEVLCRSHYTLRIHIQFANPILLYRGCGERSWCFTAPLTCFYRAYNPFLLSNNTDNAVGFFFIRYLKLFAFSMRYCHWKFFFISSLVFPFNGPIFFWNKGLNFTFSFTNNTHRYRLYTAGTQSFTYLFPQ